MVSNEKWFGASAGFYPETIDQSIRFNDDDSPQLYKTFGTPTSNTKMIYATWFKTTENGSHQSFFSGGSNSNNYMLFALSTASFYSSKDMIFFGINTSNVGRLRLFGSTSTGPFFRDNTNWYHILLAIDTTQATNTDRIHVFVNGKKITTWGSTIYPSQDYSVPLLNTAIAHNFGFNKQSTNYGSFDGYFAETYFLDGQSIFSDTSGTINSTFLADANTLAMFCEQKNGVAVPKSYSGTFGNNGVKLTYADSSNIGDDTSGNGNDFTSSGLASTDVVLDSPTNNFCTLNPLINSAQDDTATYSEGNLKYTATNAYDTTLGTFGVSSGKWYFETKLGTANNQMVGVRATPHEFNTSYLGQNASNSGIGVFAPNGNIYNETNGQTSAFGALNTGDIMQVAFDADNGYFWFGQNNTYTGTVDTSSGRFSLSSWSSGQTLFPAQGYRDSRTVNFGQDGSFAGALTGGDVGTATDSNGIGAFKYTPPSGYLALCSANLPDTTISPNQGVGFQADDHFSTVLYNGDDGTQAVTGVGFKPDWLWIKGRNASVSHTLNDSSRGVTQSLFSNSTNEEVEYSATSGNGEGVTTFGTDGFTVKHSATNNQFNVSGRTYVGWNWRCGGSAPTKTYKVVVVSDSGNKYRFRNSADSATFAQSAVTLDLQEGGTYVFDWSDSSAQGHPFRFSTTSDGTHGGGSEYTTGVVKDDSAYKTTITVAGSAPTLYYYCQIHSGMGGQVNTNTTHGSTNFDGSILSVSQTNETSGFSIATYTGNLTAGATYGHGLGTAPDIVITKSRSATGKWIFFTTAEPTKYSYLNQSSAFTTTNLDDRFGNNTSVILPSSTVVTIGTNVDVNTSGTTYVSYVFSEIEGYSKFGSYQPNGSATDGTYIHLGFSPSFFMAKSITASGYEWVIIDNKRTPFNQRQGYLKANEAEAENTSYNFVDFLSNGIKIRASSGNDVNASGHTVIYMAFADQPFKFSNAK